MSRSKKSRTDSIPTRVAVAGWEDHEFFGRKVFAELAGKTHLLELQALSLGVSINTADAVLLQTVSSIITLADPRVPPLLAGRYAASDGNPISGLSVALLTCYRARVGPWVVGRAGKMLERMADEAGPTTDGIFAWLEGRLEGGEELPGFGTPFRQSDERLPIIFERVAAAGHQGRYWQLARKICTTTKDGFSLAPNVGIPLSALALDMGFRDEQIAWIILYLLMHTLVANSVEGGSSQHALLRSLPIDSIDFRGTKRRKSPRALAADAT